MILSFKNQSRRSLLRDYHGIIQDAQLNGAIGALFRKMPVKSNPLEVDKSILLPDSAAQRHAVQRRLIRQAPIRRPVFVASCFAAATLAMSSMCFAATWSKWSPIPDTGSKWHSLVGPFVTDSVCSATAFPSTTLYVVATRASDQTIWWNATDSTQQVWDGWREIPGGAHTAYPAGISYYGSSYGSQLDVVAVGINGGWDHGVYLNSYSLFAHTWTGWKVIPGLLTMQVYPS
jgi:hypothetical protein